MKYNTGSLTNTQAAHYCSECLASLASIVITLATQTELVLNLVYRDATDGLYDVWHNILYS